MAETARWEWRLFAKRIDIRIDPETLQRTRRVAPSETYLVSAGATANPKIRDRKIDIKTLERVDDAGLEQWKPAMKWEFPLSTDQVTRIYDALNLPPPYLERAEYGLDALLALIDADDRARTVAVKKVRDQYDVEGCTVELADVSFDGDAYKTVAVENASPELVQKVVAMLGLEERENTNYVKFIKDLKGLR